MCNRGSQLHAEEIAARIEAGMVYLDGATEDPEAALWRLHNVGQRARVGEIDFETQVAQPSRSGRSR
jgi:hypothetical protein